MKEEHFYIAETSLEFIGDSYFEEIIETQITNQETLIELGKGTELVYKNEKLIEIYEYYEENRDVYRRRKEIKLEELNYKKPLYKTKFILNSKFSINGFHQIGGDFPDDFKAPNQNIATSFQYLGYIDNKDPLFSWLPFKLHITYPIYLGAEMVFLDYSNNKNPKIYNIDELIKYQSALKEVNSNSKIIFAEQKFDFEKSSDYCLEVNSGIPNWIQGHYIPNCPKSGKKMKFVCQIYNGTKAVYNDIIPESEWNKTYFEKMDFFGADLYVFIEPDSNIICLYTQGT